MVCNLSACCLAYIPMYCLVQRNTRALQVTVEVFYNCFSKANPSISSKLNTVASCQSPESTGAVHSGPADTALVVGCPYPVVSVIQYWITPIRNTVYSTFQESVSSSSRELSGERQNNLPKYLSLQHVFSFL